MQTPKPTNKICGMVPKADNRIVVVLPVCDKDVYIGTKNLKWMADLDGVIDADALVSQDSSMFPNLARGFIDAAKKAFRCVNVFKYPIPPETAWPNGANWAFQNTAWYMAKMGRPWFWMEADCVPLKPNWFKAWQDEYDKCGLPIMGPIIKGRGWMNGTAVYPANFPLLSPDAMNATNYAWDWVAEKDIRHLTHDSGALFDHVWGIVNDRPSPAEGPPATFPTQREVDKYVNPESILFHRAKDGSLQDRLRERRMRMLHSPQSSMQAATV